MSLDALLVLVRAMGYTNARIEPAPPKIYHDPNEAVTGELPAQGRRVRRKDRRA